jgi:Cu2+-exporting ATPase
MSELESSPPAANRCWHCARPFSGPSRWPVKVGQYVHDTCCAGCQAVAQAIASSGLGDYYRVRDAAAAQPIPDTASDPSLYDQPAVAARFVRDSKGGSETTLLVEGLRCGACVWLLEQTLGRQTGVTSAQVNLGSERALLRWDPTQTTLSTLIRAARRVGYELTPYGAQEREQHLARHAKARLRRLFIAGIAMMQVMMYAVPAYLAGPGGIEAEFEALMRWASLVLTLPVMLYSASPFFWGAWRDLRSLSPGMDTPVAIGLAAAFAASLQATATGEGEVWFDTITMFVFLLLGARHLEWLAKRRAGLALDRLTAARPQMVQRICGQSGLTESIPASSLSPGDLFLIGQGEALAVDAELLTGPAQFDRSLLTGESAPVTHTQGATVPGGAINLDGPMRMRATSSWSDSTLSMLERLAEGASLNRPRIKALTDRVARRFVTGLLAFAALTALVWLQIDPSQAFPVAIAVLVVSCPCALSLATPGALAAAAGQALARGLVLARADVLESMASITDVVFDKTGTLTESEPSMLKVEVWDSPGNVQAHVSGDQALAIAAGLEQGQSHPVARAFMRAAAEHCLAPAPISGSQSYPGQGVEGLFEGQHYRLGRAEFTNRMSVHLSSAGTAGNAVTSTSDPAEQIEVWLSRDGLPLARFSFSDRVREEGGALIETLRARGLELHLLSGDRTERVTKVAAALGIPNATGNASPSDKLAYVRALQARKRTVLMVGDGINDAPVLAGADVSLALAQSSMLAKTSADAVLLAGRLGQVLELYELSLKTRRIIAQNLGWAMAYNVVAIPLAALGGVSAWGAALGMSLSSLLVAGNAMRLVGERPAQPEAPAQAGFVRTHGSGLIQAGVTEIPAVEHEAQSWCPTLTSPR